MSAQTAPPAVVPPTPRHLSGGMPRPLARGPLSASLLAVLARAPGDCAPHDLRTLVRGATHARGDLLDDDDVLLTLLCLQALHHRGVSGVDLAWESDPVLVTVAHTLQEQLLATARALTDLPPCADRGSDVVRTLLDLVVAGAQPDLADWLSGDRSQSVLRERLVHASLLRLRAPHVALGVVPRLGGASPAVVAAVEAAALLGAGVTERISGYERVMRAVGLSDRFGFYVDVMPASSLAGIVSLETFAARRAHVGAAIGFVAAAAAAELDGADDGEHLLRLGYDGSVATGLRTAVDAGGLSTLLDLAAALVDHGETTASDVLLGASIAVRTRGAANRRMLAAWQEGRSSLRVCPSRPDLTAVGLGHDR